MYNGLINIYKEPGYTSFDVVARLRGILKQKKIGHTGTLDPEAEGVLVVCLGKGTKLCDVLPDHGKSYIATLLLGVETDTEDMTGKRLRENPVHCNEQQVEEVIQGFVGTSMQVPPMYSAIKVNGKKLYELAREGKVIPREPREIHIEHIQIISIDLPRVVFHVKCSKGTYIRSLCRDIGERLGCGGAMERLIRDEACGLVMQDSLTLSQVEELVSQGLLEQKIIPIDEVYKEYASLVAKPETDVYLSNGNKFSIGQMVENGKNHQVGEQVRVYQSTGQFVGLYTCMGQEYKPYKLFFTGKDI